jgi:hypothetical protein
MAGRGGIATLILAFVLNALRPALHSVNLLDGDTRPLMTAFIAILLAAVYHGWSRRLISRRSMIVLVGCLAMIEQGTEVGWGWSQVHDPNRMKLISALPDTQDLADFLATRHNPKRVEKNDTDVPFNFGDWYRIDSSNAYGASMLTQTHLLGGWWSARLGQMYGEYYWLSRTADRPGLQDVFTGRTGIKVWYDPGAFPRA